MSAAIASPAAATGSGWQIVDLGTLPGDLRSSASAVNDHGVVVGVSSGEMGSLDRAFVWRAGRMTALPGGGGTDTFAADVNNRGDVVGYRDSGNPRPVLWRDGRMIDLVELGGGYGMATAVNDSGQVVGFADIGGGPHAFSWKDGVMTDLGAPGGYSSIATDVNERGDVVGTVSVEGFGSQPVMWRNGLARPLLDVDSYVSAINDRDQVVGYGFGYVGSYVWSPRGVTEIPVPPDHLYLQMQDINNRGQVVGYSDYQAWFWQRGHITQLPSFQPIGTVAMDINNRGQIVGLSDTTPDGQHAHAVMWTR